jgi:hypothetical protein
MRLLFFFLTCFLALYACHVSTKKDLSISSSTHFDTDKGIIIQNSGPRGGPYTDPTGKRFGYAIFWTRLINQTPSILDFTINFPADSFSISPSPQSYFKLFLPSDTMTIDKEPDYDYGATGLKSFMDTGLNKTTSIQRTINPKEEYVFFVGMLMKMPDNGPVRTGLVLKEGDLFYRVSIKGQLDSALIPCGHIGFKK